MNSNDYIKLIKQARKGDKKSFDQLASMIRPRIYSYVYRVMLDEDASQDIAQETLLEMFKVIGKLRKADRFWPWARGIAYNKIRRYRSDNWKHRTISMFNDDENYNLPEDKTANHQAGLSILMGEELKSTIFSALQELKPRQRAVLVMRCYEQMDYSHIAKLMKGTELSMRVLFYRAKKSLYKQLSKNGLGKSFFLTALVLFGKMTAPSKASAAKLTVTAASTKVGLPAGLIGTVISKEAAVTTAAAGLIAATAVAAPGIIDKGSNWAHDTKEDITQQIISGLPTKTLQLQGGKTWYYYPTSDKRTLMYKQVRSQPTTGYAWCFQLQNENANYNYSIQDGTVYIENWRKWNDDLSVWLLPSDNDQIRDFISKVENKPAKLPSVRQIDEGTIVTVTRKSGEDDYEVDSASDMGDVWAGHLDFDWPVGINVVDRRDLMHKRGWTYFTVTGEARGRKVSGTGRIPFVYKHVHEHYPWIKLQVGKELKLAGKNAVNFAGLSRPWTGLHSVDVIRKDAAKMRIPFQTEDKGSGKVEVTLKTVQKQETLQLVYTIDMKKDVVEKITIYSLNGQKAVKQGLLEFSYLQEIENQQDKFTEPVRNLQSGSKGLLWLCELIQSRE